jgi:hypothetical protein
MADEAQPTSGLQRHVQHVVGEVQRLRRVVLGEVGVRTLGVRTLDVRTAELAELHATELGFQTQAHNGLVRLIRARALGGVRLYMVL